MKSMSAKKAKDGFGLLLDTARAEPVTLEKHGRPMVVVLSTEKYERFVNQANSKQKRRNADEPDILKMQSDK